MKRVRILCWCAWCLAFPAHGAPAPVTVTVDASARGPSVPDVFCGLSFETSNLLPATNGDRLFSAQNHSLIGWFRTMGIRSLRLGGGTVDLSRYPAPAPADIDSLFAFARAAGVRVIYTLPLLHASAGNVAKVARYIARRYQPQLTCFAIGNEPDWPAYHQQDPRITDYPSYLARWRKFARAIRRAVPSAKLAGPDTGSDYPVPNAPDTDVGGQSWTWRFAQDEKEAGLTAIFQHDYVGQSAKGIGAREAIDAMLSRSWPLDYQRLYDHVLGPVWRDGLTYRMTECNDFTGGVAGASNAFASALWALDYMHWWAAHHCAGVNFHNKRWIYTDTVYRNAAGTCLINPKAYGIKAFNLGAHGQIVPVIRLTNPKNLNLDCYVVGAATNLSVTIINKMLPAGRGQDASVTVWPKHFAATGAAYVVLESVPPGNDSAKAATLGGAPLTNQGPWRGSWTPLKVGRSGRCRLNVKPSTAVILQLYKVPAT